MTHPFHSIYTHKFIRVAVCTPFVRVADPQFNLERTLELARRASDLKAAVALFPQDALLDATEDALARLIAESRDLSPALIVGAPLRFEGKLFNCAVTIYRGRALGITPKTYLPNYREFYEKRQFTSGRNAVGRDVMFLGEVVPFGADLIFKATNVEDFSLHVEICEDLWAAHPAQLIRRDGGGDSTGQPLR